MVPRLGTIVIVSSAITLALPVPFLSASMYFCRIWWWFVQFTRVLVDFGFGFFNCVSSSLFGGSLRFITAVSLFLFSSVGCCFRFLPRLRFFWKNPNTLFFSFSLCDGFFVVRVRSIFDYLPFLSHLGRSLWLCHCNISVVLLLLVDVECFVGVECCLEGVRNDVLVPVPSVTLKHFWSRTKTITGPCKALFYCTNRELLLS